MALEKDSSQIDNERHHHALNKIEQKVLHCFHHQLDKEKTLHEIRAIATDALEGGDIPAR